MNDGIHTRRGSERTGAQWPRHRYRARLRRHRGARRQLPQSTTSTTEKAG